MIRLEPTEGPHTFGGPGGRTVQTLHNLRTANRYFGGARSVVRPLRRLLEASQASVVRVLDLGCGSGDIARALVPRVREDGVRVRVVAVDADPLVAGQAAVACRDCPEIDVVRADARQPPFPDKTFDYVIASMLLHYFGFEDAERLLSSWRRLATAAVIAADVERHWLPYLAIRILGRVSSSPLFHEGHGRTIRRGFTPAELRELGTRAGFTEVRVSRQFPYRLCLVGQV